ncbi:MAG: hypothetical protein V3W19_06140, partial [Desulfatiglandales bacterium]
SEHLPREIAVREAHKAMTEKIISQGESLHLRTGRSVVRGKAGFSLLLGPDEQLSAFSGSILACILRAPSLTQGHFFL